MRLVNLGENVFEQVVPVCLSFISNERAEIAYQFAELTDSNKFKGDFNSVRFNRGINSTRCFVQRLQPLPSRSVKGWPKSISMMLCEIKDAGSPIPQVGDWLEKQRQATTLYERLLVRRLRSSFPVAHLFAYGRLIDRYWMADRTDEFFNLKYESSSERQRERQLHAGGI